MKAQQRIERIRELRRLIKAHRSRSKVREFLQIELQVLVAEQLRWEAKTEKRAA